MLCDNCGKRNGNVKYTQIINGVKKEMVLCEECSQKLGIGKMDFSMPINFSSFFSDFFEEFQNSSFIPNLVSSRELKCNSCGLSFEDFMHTGKFGCEKCYDTFEDNLDEIFKSIQGSSTHIGRLEQISTKQKDNNIKKATKSKTIKNNKEKTELETLKEDLELAVKEERYEDAAKLRDKISELINKKKL